ncbi:uncharacterized protein N7483_008341 [Penicillium malachiteum]|uniref:uncharacterized protein n=1 Tax=Penicillium malachiteum TaxID=1324776 RepID=UPI002549480D|nr:uncharacterized protein N7483_008341 [Penicillium malachiteum]KAJ5720407.1 hypothetical protein N7483_008341 [Penicillium malachiteum]
MCPHHLEPGVCLRTQDVLVNVSGGLIPTPEDPEVLIEWDLEFANFQKNPSRFLEVCRHISFAGLKDGIIELLGGKPGGKPIPYRCEVCNTDVCIEIKRFDFKTALFMTKWVGLGHVIYEDDPLWKSHVFWNDEDIDIGKINDDDLQCPHGIRVVEGLDISESLLPEK